MLCYAQPVLVLDCRNVENRDRMTQINIVMKMRWPIGEFVATDRSTHVFLRLWIQSRIQRKAPNGRPSFVVKEPKRQKGEYPQAHRVFVNNAEKNRLILAKKPRHMKTIVSLNCRCSRV